MKRLSGPLLSVLIGGLGLLLLAFVGVQFLHRGSSNNGRDPLVRGHEALSQRRYQDAISEYTLALDRNPTALEAQMGRAEASIFLGIERDDLRLLEQGQGDCQKLDAKNFNRGRALALEGLAEACAYNLVEAVKNAERALPLAPNDGVALLCRGIIFLKNAELERAAAELTKAIKERPSDPRILALRARVWIAKDELKKAEADIAEALALDSNDAFSYLCRAQLERRKGKDSLAIADCRQALEANPSLTAGHILEGELALYRGDDALAWQKVQQALAVNPKSISALLLRAAIHEFRGDRRAAYQDCDEASWNDSHDPRIALVRADLQSLDGKQVAALAECTNVINRDQDPALGGKASAMRAQFRYLLGEDPQSVLKDCEQALQVDPRLLLAHVVKSRAQEALAVPNKAAADFQKAVEINGPEAYFVRGTLAARQDNSDGAMADFGEALKLSPQFARARLARARLMGQKHLPEQAIVEANQALAICPDSASAHVIRAAAYLESAHDAEAIADCQEAQRLGGASALVYGIKGQAELNAGQLAKAKADLDEAARLDRQFAALRDQAQQRLEDTKSPGATSDLAAVPAESGLSQTVAAGSWFDSFKRLRWWLLGLLNAALLLAGLLIWLDRRRRIG